jgi:uncharacterized protein YhhL (DUF1145 family)
MVMNSEIKVIELLADIGIFLFGLFDLHDLLKKYLYP